MDRYNIRYINNDRFEVVLEHVYDDGRVRTLEVIATDLLEIEAENMRDAYNTELG